jgi:hypothetical protein
MFGWNRRQFLKTAMVAPALGAVGGAAAKAAEPNVAPPRAAVKDAVRTQVLVVGAAALAVLKGTSLRSVPIRELQAKLKAAGIPL